MSARKPFVSLIGLFVLLFLVAIPSDANGVRGGSGYGQNTVFNTCVGNITSSPDSNCEGYTQGTFTIGSNAYNGDLFAFLAPGGTDSGVLDILQINANSSLSLNLTSLAASTGIFACGSFGTSLSTAQDSLGTDMPGLHCTTGASDMGYVNPSQTISGVTETPGPGPSGVTFDNTLSSPAAVFVTDGDISGATFTPTSATVTPEPGSLMLLGVGLLALGVLASRPR